MSLNDYKIIPLNAFKDNYIWIIINGDKKTAAVVDPGDAQPVLEFLKKQQLQLTTIFLSHHHWDHSGGIAELKRHYSDMTIFGKTRDNVPELTHLVKEGKEVKFEQITFEILDIPGHTLDHIAYYSPGILFCGDTLFSAGCGRVFEGTPEQMYASLQKIAALPNNTAIYCGHEYTLNNLLFAQAVEPDNEYILHKIEQATMLRSRDIPTIPSLLSEEKTFNPFLRCEQPTVIHAAEKYKNKILTNQVDVFAVIREWKNHF